ncbi:MAG: hypothetical protein CME25_05510 [Gemmatimonadetes bacterium]|nr:hypothetical protein [Gemmatimonadota bacterium]|tara:strand:- start:29 stop:571 length:543 start_codon:yes stop_codon:yes gene_type:complete
MMDIVEIKPINFDDFALQDLERYGVNKAESTRSWDQTTVGKHLIPFLGRRFLKEIRAKDLEEYKSYRVACLLKSGRQIKKSTANREVDLLKRAVEWGYLKSNLAKGVKKFRVDMKELKLSGNPGDRSGVRLREEDVAEFVRNRTIKAQWRKLLLNVGMLVAVPNLGLNVIATCIPQDYLL